MHSISFNRKISKTVIYILLILVVIITVLPFIWMLSASIKTDREVFQMNPFVLIPENAQWSNYIEIWDRIPLATFIKKYCFINGSSYCPTIIYQLLCSLCICKNGVYRKKIFIFSLYFYNRYAVASIYDSPVFDDEKDGVKRYSVGYGNFAGIFSIWCILNETVLYEYTRLSL